MKMDTIYMRERAYRLTESLRRDNRREQRRLDDKLFSKQGMATTHKMELLALAEEQRKLREDLTRIKKSSATSWGLLPPRHGEPDIDEELLRNLSNERVRTERSTTGAQSMGRSLLASYTAGDFHHSDPLLHLSNLDSPDQVGEPSRPRKLKKQSLIKLDKESKRTEETLKKFNEAFPSDGSPISTGPSKEQRNDPVRENPNQTDVGNSLLPQRKHIKSEGNERKGSLVPSTSSTLEPIEFGSSLMSVSKRKVSEEGNKPRRSSQSISFIKRRKNSQSAPDAPGGKPNRGSLSVPKALQYLANESSPSLISEDGASPKKASSLMPSMNTIDVQDARDKIVKRLLGHDSLAKSNKTKVDSSKEVRGLSPIREQKTEVSLGSKSMPQMTTNFPSNISEPLSSKGPKKKKAEKVEEANDGAPKFDSYKYNPDGSLRTMHVLPDFAGRLEEAKRARYIRHTEKQWFEKELKVNEIFEDR